MLNVWTSAGGNFKSGRPELLIACGAARAAVKLFSKEEALATADGLLDRIEKVRAAREEAKKQSEAGNGDEMAEGTFRSRPFFADQAAQTEFQERHRRPERKTVYPQPGSTLRAYLGIDSGSTTTKFALIDEREEILGSFYAPNEGDPLTVAKTALIDMRERYRQVGADLQILAAGTTGYGEMLFAKAFDTECHTVETVAHARAAEKYVKDATFLLDIGGQDMKASGWIMALSPTFWSMSLFFRMWLVPWKFCGKSAIFPCRKLLLPHFHLSIRQPLAAAAQYL